MELNKLICLPTSKLTTAAIEQYETRAKQWGRDFVGVYHSTNVTPYIHAMMYHVGEFMSIHGSIVPFTQQGLEKYNDIMTKVYFQSSSHCGVEALRQIVEKRNRIEYFIDNGSKQAKNDDIVCSNCQSAGHNRLTCTNTVKPPNFGGSNVVRCREVVPILEVIVEVTPLDNGLSGCGLSLTARGHRKRRR